MKYFSLGCLLLFLACTSNGQKNLTSTPEKFSTAIQTQNIQLLDVRTAEEYKSGHIKNALQANWLNRAEFDDRTSHLDKQKPIFIYCLSGGRSGAAAQALTAQGYTVTNLEGGINAWKRENMPLEGVDPNAAQTSMKAFEGQIMSKEIVLVDFGAVWCPPCKKMEPVLQEFMAENNEKLMLLKMDGGIETELMKSLNVEALPTFILFVHGKEVKRKQGLVSKEEFNAWIN
jgi:thioredoxin